MIRVLVTAPFCDAAKKKMTEDCGDICRFSFVNPTARDYMEQLREAEVVIGEPELSDIFSAGNIRFIQMTWAGTEKYTAADNFPRGILLANMSGAFGGIISEYVIGSIIAMYRDFPRYISQKNQRIWQDTGKEECLWGKKVLILGTGDIGSSIAVRLSAFGTMNTGVCRQNTSPKSGFDNIYKLDRLSSLLPEADIVIGCIPGNKETAGLLNRDRLQMMKHGSLLVNVGRGSLVDIDALAEVLESGHLFGAILDVAAPEPLPKEHVLWGMDNVFITPHISGPSFGHSKRTEFLIENICAENLRRYADGRHIINEVDFETGYRRPEK